MDRTQQIAALRRELRSVFPTSHPSGQPGSALHVEGAGLSTGLLSLDRLLSGHGLPRGRISELTGGPSSGKTALALHIVATTTGAGLPVAYIDAARAFYPPSAAAAGIALDRLLVLRTADLAGALTATDIVLRGQAFPLVVFDWGIDPPPGAGAPDLGAAIARLNGLAALSQSVLLFITTPKTARDPLRYYATLRLEVRRETSGREGGYAAVETAGRGGRDTVETAGRGGNAAVGPREVEEAPPRRLRLVGVPMARAADRLTVQVIKNKLGPPGSRVEVASGGYETAGLPLHPGDPDPDPSAR